MEITENTPLAPLLYYKIGGTARYLITVHSVEEIIDAVKFIDKQGIKNILPIGFGANLLISDNGFNGAVIQLVSDMRGIKKEEDTLSLFAGVSLDDVIQFSFQHNLVGLEWAGGLPSTVGAGIRGNVGCFGKEIKDIVQSVDVIDVEDSSYSLKTLLNEDMKFAYRTSTIKQQHSLLLVRATIKLREASEEQLLEAKHIYAANITYRKEHHPVEYPSCGSVFKNIVTRENVERVITVWPDAKELVEGKWHNKVAMGYVINRLGLTGKQIGNAQISKKHANYIVNLGGASFQDVYTLIQEIQHKVEDTFGFSPEPEVQIIP